MRNFAKSVLNYFATYTETRFRFATKRLAYQWADDRQHDLNWRVSATRSCASTSSACYHGGQWIRWWMY